MNRNHSVRLVLLGAMAGDIAGSIFEKAPIKSTDYEEQQMGILGDGYPDNHPFNNLPKRNSIGNTQY